MIKPEHLNSTIYCKSIDANIEVIEENADVLKIHAPHVFVDPKKSVEKAEEKLKHDLNK